MLGDRERIAIGDPVSRRFTSESNRTPKRFRSDSGTYHVRRTVVSTCCQFFVDKVRRIRDNISAALQSSVRRTSVSTSDHSCLHSSQ